MTSLRQLKLAKCRVTEQDLECLVRLANLEFLTFSHVKPLFGNTLVVSCLAQLPRIATLCIEECRHATDYSFISACTQLRELSLCHNFDPDRQLSRAEMEAIAQLHRLEKLSLLVPLQHPHMFSLFCNHLQHLSELKVWYSYRKPPVPAAALSSLPALSRLETFWLAPLRCEDFGMLVDCMVQMPRLRRVQLQHRLSDQDEARLRDALPRLETLL